MADLSDIEYLSSLHDDLVNFYIHDLCPSSNFVEVQTRMRDIILQVEEHLKGREDINPLIGHTSLRLIDPNRSR